MLETMALRDVLTVATLLTVGLSALGTPLSEQECVVHPLSPEVVQQLLAGTNATIRHMQEIKSLLRAPRGSGDRLDVAETADVLQHHISAEILFMLLTKLDKEQTRYTQELEQVKEEMRALERRNSGGASDLPSRPQEPPPVHVTPGGITPPRAALPRDDTCYPPSDW